MAIPTDKLLALKRLKDLLDAQPVPEPLLRGYREMFGSLSPVVRVTLDEAKFRWPVSRSAHKGPIRYEHVSISKMFISSKELP